MIKKNRQGRVVEFVDESILPSRQAASRTVARGEAIDAADARPALPATRYDVERSYEKSVAEAGLATAASEKAEMDRLGAMVSNIEGIAKKAREDAKERFRAAKNEAELRRKCLVEVAEQSLEAELSRIRTEFKKNMDPVNAEAVQVRARYEEALDGAVKACAKLRDEQLAALAEAERLDAKMAVVAEGQGKDEPAPTSPGESTTSP